MAVTKHPKVKVADVAARVGVSTTVVYSFLNGQYYGNGESSRIGVSSETRDNIRKIARDLGFMPDDLIVRARLYPELSGFAMMLCDNVPEGISNPYFSRIFRGLSDHVGDTRRGIAFAAFSLGHDYMADPGHLPEGVRNSTVNKVVVAGDINYSLLLALRRAGCAVVYASRDVGMEGVPGVVPAYRDAAWQALSHLAGLGHRQIALGIGRHVKTQSYYYRELTEGCAEAWNRLGLDEPSPRYVAPTESAGVYLERILDEVPGVTAIFCFDDFAANDLIFAATQRGLSVPGDLSVVGCNDEIRPYVPVPLTTIHFPKALIGLTAGQLADRLTNPENSETVTTVTLPVQLTERASCGKVPAALLSEPLHA
jgi:LacI family transcriptional regulator